MDEFYVIENLPVFIRNFQVKAYLWPQISPSLYRFLIRPVLFLFDPERIHRFTFFALRILFAFPLTGLIFRLLFKIRSEKLAREVFGIRFSNPVGLAAGFDKEGLIAEKWENLGFGFAELGTVTPLPQVGNPPKRLFRLPEDKALINRMGFNNGGVEKMAECLKKGRKGRIVIGGNIGKNKDTLNENALADYVQTFNMLFPYVDYFVINVSSPNSPGLRDLQEKEPLKKLLLGIRADNEKQKRPKPVLLKISPDLTEGQIDDILNVVSETGVAGIVAANSTTDRSGLKTPESVLDTIGAGGLTGAPILEKSIGLIRYISKKTGGKLPVIGVGGILSPDDALRMLDAGASLIQVYTGFIYNGPGFARRICRAILKGTE